jgi:hypothetical protein
MEYFSSQEEFASGSAAGSILGKAHRTSAINTITREVALCLPKIRQIDRDCGRVTGHSEIGVRTIVTSGVSTNSPSSSSSRPHNAVFAAVTADWKGIGVWRAYKNWKFLEKQARSKIHYRTLTAFES